MKIYQTTVRTFYLFPETNEIISDVMDITNDITLNTNMNDAISDHKDIVDVTADEDVFNVTCNDNKVHIENDDIYIENIIETVNDECITKTIIETITREV